MIEGRNIVCIASNWWYDPTSKHHVMKLLSERNHVIWVNYHASRRPRVGVADARAIAGKVRQFVEGPRRITDNMTVITPMVVPLPGSKTIANLNRRLLTRQIKSVLRTLPARPVQLWSFAPDIDFLVGQFEEECAVYYCVDEFSEFGGYDRDAILRLESRLAGKADLVIATSRKLYQSKRRICSEAVLVTHGVDYEHFASHRSENVPADTANLQSPVLGFWGLIQDWVDVDLIASVARLRPNWSIVLVGEVHTNISALSGLTNVHLLGRRPYQQLPAYAAAFDVGIIPFRINELTLAVNPIKLREYLCAGLPVVSTPLPEVEAYREWVEIAATPEQFVAACEDAMRGDSESQRNGRRAMMQNETWRSKVEAISDHLRRVLAGKPGQSQLTASLTNSLQMG